MMFRYISYRWAALLTLATPGTAFAQPTIGFVVTAPAGGSVPAPAFSLTFAVVTTLALLAIAAIQIRRRGHVSATAALIGAIAVMGVGVTEAGVPDIEVDGDECNAETTHPFVGESDGEQLLKSLCANTIRVVSIECEESFLWPPETEPACEVGTMLATEETCTLPTCQSIPFIPYDPNDPNEL